MQTWIKEIILDEGEDLVVGLPGQCERFSDWDEGFPVTGVSS